MSATAPSRTTLMTERLPAPYAIDPGSHLTDLLDIVALQLAIFDEDMDRVQRSGWVDDAFTIGDLARLGSLFGVEPAPWEPRRLFRSRLKATVGAMLRGSVTRAELTKAIDRIIDGAQDALRTRYVGPGRVGRVPLVEFPETVRRAHDLGGTGGLLRPHDRATIDNQGLTPTVVQLAVTGVAGDRTAQPMVINHTTGAAIGFRGLVAAGRILRLRSADGELAAELDGRDVSDQVFSISGDGWDDGAADDQPTDRTVLVEDERPQPLPLAVGHNELQLVSLARYDDPGLDVAMAARPSAGLHQGRFDAGSWDGAVFHQEPVAALEAWWVERRPASFRFDVPAGVVVRDPIVGRDPEADRARLFELLQSTVGALRGAAIDGQVRPRPLSERQSSGDRLTVLAPVATTEVASAGRPELTGIGADFDETPRDRGRYQ